MAAVHVDPKSLAAALRRLADDLDNGRAQVNEIGVNNDVDLVELSSEPHEHQRHDVVFRGQHLRISATSMRDLFEEA